MNKRTKLKQSASAGPVLVFGDDTRSFLAVVRSLGRQGISVHAAPFKSGRPALSSCYIRKVHYLPAFDGSDRWIDALLEVIASNQIDLLVPCCDRAILCLDKYRDRLTHLKVAAPNRLVLDTLFDKHLTRQMAANCNVAVSPGRLLSKADTEATLAKEFGLPLVIKPRKSYSLDDLVHRGNVEVVQSSSELRKVLSGLDNRSEFIVERFFGGTGVGVSLLAHNGKTLCAFQHGRLRESPSGRGSSYRESEPLDEAMLDAARRIAAKSKLTGVAMFEFRRNADSGKWVLLEVNARFWGSLPLPVALGVDFPYYLYRLLMQGEEVEQPSYPVGIRARNFIFNAYDLILKDTSSDQFSNIRFASDLLNLLVHPFAILLGQEYSDTFQSDDLKPAFKEFIDAPFEAIRRLRGRGAGTSSSYDQLRLGNHKSNTWS